MSHHCWQPGSRLMHSYVVREFRIEPIIQEEIIKYVLARYKRIVFTCQRDVNFDIKKRTRDDQLYKGFSQFIIWAFTGDKRKELIEMMLS